MSPQSNSSHAEFALDSRIEAASIKVLNLSLCQVRLMDDARFPWLLLIPQQAGAEEWTDLSQASQHVLADEIAAAVSTVRGLFKPDKMNVATLGNQVRQLHVHVIARNTVDAAWPDAVWCHGQPSPYADATRISTVESLRSSLSVQ